MLGAKLTECYGPLPMACALAARDNRTERVGPLGGGPGGGGGKGGKG